MTQRETSIDILKILAMFMVVFYHCCYYSLDYGYTPGAGDYVPNLARAIMNLCSMGVPLFFMCSGYCTLSSPTSGWKKMGKKVLTIILLTIFWNGLIPFPAWFFITLAALYLITPALRWAKYHYPRLYWCGMVCIGLASFGLNEAYTLSRLFAPNCLDGYRISGALTSYALVYYALGDGFKGRAIPLAAVLVALVAGFILSLADGTLLTHAEGEMFDGVNAAFPMLSTLLMSCAVFSLAQHVRIPPTSAAGKSLAAIANGCLVVFLFHLFLQLESEKLFTNSQLSFSIPMSIAWTLLICALSWSIGMLLRRIPYVCYLVKM